jgi:hypothetical protein
MDINYRIEHITPFSTDSVSKPDYTLKLEAVGYLYEIEWFKKLLTLALENDKLMKLALNSQGNQNDTSNSS